MGEPIFGWFAAERDYNREERWRRRYPREEPNMDAEYDAYMESQAGGDY